ncbi:MAG: CBS domain-containing protein [Gammaproteobacteria bacterium]|nr:CBS domain-containing protein [Gammaproteobacteria bacterium]
METVRQLLEEKGHEVWTIGPDASVYDAVALMSDKEIGALTVVQDGKVVGLISERDYARKVILKGRASKATQVRDIMTARVVYARPDQTVEECMAVVTDQRVRHLPVMENGRLIGIISIGDLVKAIIAEQKFIIEQLLHYITS